MNYNTQRIRDYNPAGMIDSKLFKHSTEYLVLAVLKLHMPLKFKNAKLLERPDIQIDGLGVEVTIADEREIMQVTNEFSKYCKGDNIEQRKNTIEKDGRHKIESKVIGNKQVTALARGGGADFDKCLIKIGKRIKDKIESIKKYAKDFNGLIELAVLQKDRLPGIDHDKLGEYVLELLADSNTLTMVYYVDNDLLLSIDLKQKELIKMNHSDCYGLLEKMARMTAEGIISLRDEEWSE